MRDSWGARLSPWGAERELHKEGHALVTPTRAWGPAPPAESLVRPRAPCVPAQPAPIPGGSGEVRGSRGRGAGAGVLAGPWFLPLSRPWAAPLRSAHGLGTMSLR